jgi:hypothetical protein
MRRTDGHRAERHPAQIGTRGVVRRAATKLMQRARSIFELVNSAFVPIVSRRPRHDRAHERMSSALNPHP